MYTVYYIENDSPAEQRIAMISAPTPEAAQRIAELKFADSTILKVVELTPPEQEARFPSARFINGEFRPVLYHDEIH